MATAMQVGKKYIALVEDPSTISIERIYECVYISPGGLAIICNSKSGERYILKANWDYWKEYKKPKGGKFWVNVYPNGFRVNHCAYSDKEIADNHAAQGRIACVEVKWTEGQGL